MSTCDEIYFAPDFATIMLATNGSNFDKFDRCQPHKSGRKANLKGCMNRSVQYYSFTQYNSTVTQLPGVEIGECVPL